MRKPLMLLLMGLLLCTLCACETAKGFGKDMEDAGAWVQKQVN